MYYYCYCPVGRGGQWLECARGNREVAGSNPAGTARKLCQNFTFKGSFFLSEDTLKSVSVELLSGVYARGCKISHTGGKCVVDSIILPGDIIDADWN